MMPRSVGDGKLLAFDATKKAAGPVGSTGTLFVPVPHTPVASNENDTEIRGRFLLTPVNWGGRG